MLRGHPGFCRKSHSPFPIKNPTETAHVSAKASAKTEGNGSCPLLREHQSNFWNWRYSYHRVLWLSLLIARLSATLYCQSGTDDLHSAALFQVILFFERRHSTEWPSISQLRIQVSSQQILDVVCLEMTLWRAFELAVVKEERRFPHLTQQRAWVGSRDPCQIQAHVERTTHCSCTAVISATD